MKFSTREDIDAPIEEAFDLLCAFDQYERAAMRRGADVNRRAKPSELGIGSIWDVHFFLRGKERKVTLEVVTLERPEKMKVAMSARGFSGAVEFELIALSRSRTRLVIGFEVTPLTLPARLLLQSLKLTKSTLDQKYKIRVSNFIDDLQQRLSPDAQSRS